MKKVIIVFALFVFVVIGITACNTYERCPAYTDIPSQTQCDRL